MMKRNFITAILVLESLIILRAQNSVDLDTSEAEERVKADKRAFEAAASGKWQQIFMDSCTGDWQDQWFLDGLIGKVSTGPEGMVLAAGPEFKNDAHHMVLWTKQEFKGDLKIEYEVTRLDDETRCVNILYIQATGSGAEPYFADITKWNELRRVPAMRMYFDHMHAYHISYAAFPNNEDTTSYIRARRYMPDANGLDGTDLEPDYFPLGLFQKDVPHRITVVKKDRDIYMRVENPDQVYYCHMENSELPPVIEGRIGLRLMFTRASQFRNFRVSAAD